MISNICYESLIHSVLSHRYLAGPQRENEEKHQGRECKRSPKSRNHPEYFIESISDNNWQSYIQQMSTSGSWCDNIIIQAVSNAFNCIIHITESHISKPDGTFITPVLCQEQPKTKFIGYINELHYVSSVLDKTGKNKSFS